MAIHKRSMWPTKLPMCQPRPSPCLQFDFFDSSRKPEDQMATLGLIEYKDASTVVKAVYDHIMATSKDNWVNNFCKDLAHGPVTLKRTWEDIQQIMAPGALVALTK